MEAITETDEGLSQHSKEEIKFEEEKPIKDYLEFVKKCMKSMAMLPLFESDHYKHFDILYMLFVDLISFQVSIFSLIDFIFTWDGNIFKATMSLINIIIYATSTIILLYFQVNTFSVWNDQYANDWAGTFQVYRREVLYLMNFINSTFKYRSAEGLTRLNMRASFEKARKYSKIFAVLCLIGAIHYAVEPLLIESGFKLYFIVFNIKSH